MDTPGELLHRSAAILQSIKEAKVVLKYRVETRLAGTANQESTITSLHSLSSRL